MMTSSFEDIKSQLRLSCIQGNFEKVQEILGILQKRNFDANIIIDEELEKTALIYCAEYGYLQICNYLLQNGAQCDAKDKGKWTPLHYAAKEGHFDVCAVLLQNGASVSEMNEANLTPLHIATNEDHSEICNLLIENGAAAGTFEVKKSKKLM